MRTPRARAPRPAMELMEGNARSCAGLAPHEPPGCSPEDNGQYRRCVSRRGGVRSPWCRTGCRRPRGPPTGHCPDVATFVRQGGTSACPGSSQLPSRQWQCHGCLGPAQGGGTLRTHRDMATGGSWLARQRRHAAGCPTGPRCRPVPPMSRRCPSAFVCTTLPQAGRAIIGLPSHDRGEPNSELRSVKSAIQHTLLRCSI